MESASRANQRVLRWLSCEGMDEYRMARRMLTAEESERAGTTETKVRLDGWCERLLRQQRYDGGGSSSMRERSERVESPGTYVTD